MHGPYLLAGHHLRDSFCTCTNLWWDLDTQSTLGSMHDGARYRQDRGS